jgi:hypothetical protein
MFVALSWKIVWANRQKLTTIGGTRCHGSPLQTLGVVPAEPD